MAARHLINAYLLGELAPVDDHKLASHVRRCVACAAEMRSATRVIGLLVGLPAPESSPDLDERIILAALDDRRRRHDLRSWRADLPILIFRGAARTTGTLLVTIVTVALLGGAFVFAAAGFITQTAQLPPPSGTVGPEVTPTLAPTRDLTAAPTAPPKEGTSAPAVIDVTPVPSEKPTLQPSLEATPSPTPSATSEPSTEPTASPEPTATPTPTPTPTPIPTEKPRRTPPPTLAASSSAPSASSADSTTSP